MELVELHVREAGTGAEGRGGAVASGDRGIGGVGVELAGSAAGQDHGIRVEAGHRARGIHRLDSADAAVGDQQVADEGELEDAHPGGAHGPQQRALDARSSGITPCVQDARARMRRLAAPREHTVLPVELDTERQQVPDALRPLGAEDLDGLARVEPRPRGKGVLDVGVDAVVGEHRRRDAALGVPGVALPQLRLGDEGDRVGALGAQGRDESGDTGTDDDHRWPGHRQSPITSAGATAPGWAASMRSRATRAGAATCSGTVIRLSTSPRTSASSTQAR